MPAAYALPASIGKRFLKESLPKDEFLLALDPASDLHTDRLADVAARVRAARLPDPLLASFHSAFASLRREGAQSVAVRSSSTQEDQDDASAAGLHATFLNLETEESVAEAIKACWASLFSVPVLGYLRKRKITPEAAVGVVLQAMVPADVAGVMFTINPLTGDAGEIVINASYGLGSSVVEGRVSPDTLRVDKATGTLRDRVIGEKRERTVLSPGGGIREEQVPADQVREPALDPAVTAELVALGHRIEAHFGGPRDIEWAVSGGTIYILQARPITAVSRPSTRRWAKRRLDRPDRSRIVWSNVNVGEALPGVATPLTWSVLSGFSDLGFRRAFGALGCTVPKDAELVGQFRGRIYLNLTEIMTILAQVPGLRPRVLLTLGGGGEVERLEEEIQPPRRTAFMLRLPLTISRFISEHLNAQDRVETFETFFQSERDRILNLDLRVLSPSSLARTLTDVERLLDETGSTMLGVYGNLLASIAFLHSIFRVLLKDDADHTLRDLLTGLSDLESTAPGISLWHIAEMAKAEPDLRAILEAGRSTDLKIADLPDGPTRRAMERFLRAYGSRGTREAELSEPRWSEDPTLLFAALQVHLRSPAGAERPIDLERNMRRIREAAETRVRGTLPTPAWIAVRRLLTQVQRYLRLRERLRSDVTRVLGMFRSVALEASRRIDSLEPSAGHGAAFFLTLDELHDFLRGQGVLAARVRQRRRQYERDRLLPDPPDTFVGSPPASPAAPGNLERLRGLGASAGQATGLARIVRSPADAGSFQPGEVLVANCADVGWSPLFLAASAVVTDLGGPLSHAAIVLREYGVPAVVNVKVGTRVIRTGDRLEVDGDRGQVHINR